MVVALTALALPSLTTTAVATIARQSTVRTLTDRDALKDERGVDVGLTVSEGSSVERFASKAAAGTSTTERPRPLPRVTANGSNERRRR